MKVALRNSKFIIFFTLARSFINLISFYSKYFGIMPRSLCELHEVNSVIIAATPTLANYFFLMQQYIWMIFIYWLVCIGP